VSTTEVEWDENEQSVMLALGVYRSRVGPCGHYLPDSTAAENEFGWSVVASRCHECTAVSAESNRFAENPHPHAMLYAATRG
jgi:hypothetical protein